MCVNFFHGPLENECKEVGDVLNLKCRILSWMCTPIPISQFARQILYCVIFSMTPFENRIKSYSTLKLSTKFHSVVSTETTNQQNSKRFYELVNQRYRFTWPIDMLEHSKVSGFISGFLSDVLCLQTLWVIQPKLSTVKSHVVQYNI